jgi:cell division protein FtsL
MSAASQQGSGSGGGTFTPLLLAVLIMASAVAVVQVKQHSRNLTTEVDTQRQERERLQLEWAQLQLEQATLAQHGRVDERARSQFDMVDPLDYQIVAEDGSGGAASVTAQVQVPAAQTAAPNTGAPQ